jgi:two-component system, cell cycle sensor histidine kinase and response regulator CckA
MAPKEPKVLVVEDDEETLNVISRTLAAGGYDVVWARNGDDALKVLGRLDQAVALILTDVVLPGMSGPELVEEVTRSLAPAKAIYISAYDKDTVRSHGVDPDTMPFLPKPYEPSELVRMVSEVLGTR